MCCYCVFSRSITLNSVRRYNAWLCRYFVIYKEPPPHIKHHRSSLLGKRWRRRRHHHYSQAVVIPSCWVSQPTQLLAHQSRRDFPATPSKTLCQWLRLDIMTKFLGIQWKHCSFWLTQPERKRHTESASWMSVCTCVCVLLLWLMHSANARPYRCVWCWHCCCIFRKPPLTGCSKVTFCRCRDFACKRRSVVCHVERK